MRGAFKSAPGPLAAQLRVRLVGRMSRVSVYSSLQVLFFIRNCSSLALRTPPGLHDSGPTLDRRSVFLSQKWLFLRFETLSSFKALQNRFGTDFEAILAPKMVQKSIKNRYKIDVCIRLRFLIDFSFKNL